MQAEGSNVNLNIERAAIARRWSGALFFGGSFPLTPDPSPRSTGPFPLTPDPSPRSTGPFPLTPDPSPRSTGRGED